MVCKPFRKSLHRLTPLLLLAVVLGGICTGCGEMRGQESSSAGSRKIVVGLSLATLKEDRWVRDRDIFTAKGRQEGIDVIVSNANNDPQVQYEQVQDMIQRKIDVLVIAPQDKDSAAKCVQDAKKAGIPVISYDRLVRNANADVYISFDTVKVGELQADALLNEAPQGGYLILNGSQNDNNTILSHEGCMNQLNSSIKNGKVQVLAETWVEDWRREGAYSFVSEKLKQYPNQIKAIIAGNDSLAWGAIDALSEAKLAKKVLVVGEDADLAACQRIVDGSQLLTVYKPIDKLVEQTVQICKTLAAKQKISYTRTIQDGTYNIPYVMIDVIAVTKNNIDSTVIKDGFQLKDDVYRTQNTSSK